jgi:hypothetical protein
MKIILLLLLFLLKNVSGITVDKNKIEKRLINNILETQEISGGWNYQSGTSCYTSMDIRLMVDMTLKKNGYSLDEEETKWLESVRNIIPARMQEAMFSYDPNCLSCRCSMLRSLEWNYTFLGMGNEDILKNFNSILKNLDKQYYNIFSAMAPLTCPMLLDIYEKKNNSTAKECIELLSQITAGTFPFKALIDGYCGKNVNLVEREKIQTWTEDSLWLNNVSGYDKIQILWEKIPMLLNFAQEKEKFAKHIFDLIYSTLHDDNLFGSSIAYNCKALLVLYYIKPYCPGERVDELVHNSISSMLELKDSYGFYPIGLRGGGDYNRTCYNALTLLETYKKKQNKPLKKSIIKGFGFISGKTSKMLDEFKETKELSAEEDKNFKEIFTRYMFPASSGFDRLILAGEVFSMAESVLDTSFSPSLEKWLIDYVKEWDFKKSSWYVKEYPSIKLTLKALNILYGYKVKDTELIEMREKATEYLVSLFTKENELKAKEISFIGPNSSISENKVDYTFPFMFLLAKYRAESYGNIVQIYIKNYLTNNELNGIEDEELGKLYYCALKTKSPEKENLKNEIDRRIEKYYENTRKIREEDYLGLEILKLELGCPLLYYYMLN